MWKVRCHLNSTSRHFSKMAALRLRISSRNGTSIYEMSLWTAAWISIFTAWSRRDFYSPSHGPSCASCPNVIRICGMSTTAHRFLIYFFFLIPFFFLLARFLKIFPFSFGITIKRFRAYTCISIWYVKVISILFHLPFFFIWIERKNK